MKPLAHWLGKFGYEICKCKHCKRSKKWRKEMGFTKAARQHNKRVIEEELNEGK